MIDTVIFRADASATMGSGHVARCLTLAEVMKQKGFTVHFVSASGTLEVVPRLREVADAIHELPYRSATVSGAAQDKWLDVSEAEDAELTIGALPQSASRMLIVDHYGLGAHWEQALRPHVNRIMVIDDLLNRPHVCDVLLDQNVCSNQGAYRDLVPPECTRLLGPQYALLRPEFKIARCSQRKPRNTVNRVLISFGGADGANATERAMDALEKSPAFDHVDVVIGSAHPFRSHLTERCGELGFELHVDSREMANLIWKADIAIGAGGASSWERAYLGLPCLIMTTAENQEPIAHAVAACGAGIYMGDLRNCSSDSVAATLNEVLTSATALSQMEDAAYDLMRTHKSTDSLISEALAIGGCDE